MRMKILQEAGGVRQMEVRIGGFDANKEAVQRRRREAMHVEYRVVRLRQPVQSEHSKYRGERCAENGKLKRDGNESRPAIERATANVHWVAAHIRPNLEEETCQTPAEPAKQGDPRHTLALHPERFPHTVPRTRTAPI